MKKTLQAYLGNVKSNVFFFFKNSNYMLENIFFKKESCYIFATFWILFKYGKFGTFFLQQSFA